MEATPPINRGILIILALQLLALLVGFGLIYSLQLEVIRKLDAIHQQIQTSNQHMTELKAGLRVLVPGISQ